MSNPGPYYCFWCKRKVGRTHSALCHRFRFGEGTVSRDTISWPKPPTDTRQVKNRSSEDPT